MRFLIKSHDEYGPHFGVLFDVLPKVYGDENIYGDILKFDVMRSASELSHRKDTDGWRPYLSDSTDPTKRRALVIPIDSTLQDEAEYEAWRDFALEALNHGTVDGKSLAADVDLIVLAREPEQPEIFSDRNPDTSRLVDYSHLAPYKGRDSSLQILTDALTSGFSSTPKSKSIGAEAVAVRKPKSVDADDDFQP
ncbi:hypothetical protein [Pseudomonas serbica]|uniref:hypothetical protein n=1 Tax=Pseudomonas serbica TaxID=2965074 RepID=UPI00237B7D53|nr:hypothetical protein [Pseudomonas serbica]